MIAKSGYLFSGKIMPNQFSLPAIRNVHQIRCEPEARIVRTALAVANGLAVWPASRILVILTLTTIKSVG